MNSPLSVNEFISISSIVIIYELVILSLYFTKLINLKIASKLVSFLVLLNLFIIFVMFLTDCNIDDTTKIIIVSIKILLLIAVLFISKFSFMNFFISLVLLGIYYLFSNINKVYSCDVKMVDLGKSLLFSSLIYGGLMLSNQGCNIVK
jgi:hypothetical protein